MAPDRRSPAGLANSGNPHNLGIGATSARPPASAGPAIPAGPVDPAGAVHPGVRHQPVPGRAIDGPSPGSVSGMRRTLRTLTVLQHVLFVGLTVVCVARSAATGAPLLPLGSATVALLAWYCVGAAAAVRHRTDDPDATPTALRRLPAGQAGLWWLVGLTALWLVLVAISPENVWLAFSLWLLAGHFLPAGWAVAYAAAVLAVVVYAPHQQTGQFTVAGVLGSGVGAMFALVVSRGQVQLARVAIERQQLLDSLVAAHQEAEILHAELAAAQRESGMLEERTRLSREIHDTLAQGFSSIVLLARAGRATPQDQQLRPLIEQIEQTAAANLDEARRVVDALAPRELEGSGLAAALHRILAGFQAETGIDTDLRVEGEVTALPTGHEVALLRTAQGALANVRQHADAGRVVLSLSGLDDSVRLDIVDDGVGFDPDAATARPTDGRTGYGLPSTRARLRELGGGLEIESAPGEGTALTAFVPRPGGGR